MAADRIEVVQDGEMESRGFAVIRIPNVYSRPTDVSFRIGYRYTNEWLGEDGYWRRSMTLIQPRDWRFRDGSLELLIGPEIVRAIEPDQPVRIECPGADAEHVLLWPTLGLGAGAEAPPKSGNGAIDDGRGAESMEDRLRAAPREPVPAPRAPEPAQVPARGGDVGFSARRAPEPPPAEPREPAPAPAQPPAAYRGRREADYPDLEPIEQPRRIGVGSVLAGLALGAAGMWAAQTYVLPNIEGASAENARFEELQRQLAESDDRAMRLVNARVAEREEQEAALKSRDDRIAELEKQSTALQDRIVALREGRQPVEDERNDRIRELEGLLRQAATQRQSLETEVARIAAERDQANEAAASLRGQAAIGRENAAEVDDLNGRIAAAEQQAQTAEARLAEISRERDLAMKTVADLRERLAGAEQGGGASDAERDRLLEALQRSEREAENAKSAASDLRARLAGLEEQLAAAKTSGDGSQQLQVQQAMLIAAQRERDAARRELEELKREVGAGGGAAAPVAAAAPAAADSGAQLTGTGGFGDVESAMVSADPFLPQSLIQRDKIRKGLEDGGTVRGVVTDVLTVTYEQYDKLVETLCSELPSDRCGS